MYLPTAAAAEPPTEAVHSLLFGGLLSHSCRVVADSECKVVIAFGSVVVMSINGEVVAKEDDVPVTTEVQVLLEFLGLPHFAKLVVGIDSYHGFERLPIQPECPFGKEKSCIFMS